MQWSTPSGMIAPGIVMARALLPDDSFTAAVPVMNVSDETVVIGKGCTLTNLESVCTVEEDDVRMDEPPAHIRLMVDHVDPAVPQTIRDELERLLNRYTKAISSGPLDMGRTNLVTHKIDTGGHPPIRQALRPTPHAKRHEVDQDVNEKLSLNIIEPACSPHASTWCW